MAATDTVGAPGAILSSAWAWALDRFARLVVVLMAVEASAMARCACGFTAAEEPSKAVPNMLVIVLESAKLTVLPPAAAVLRTVTKLAMTLAPAPAEAVSAKAAMVATWAAAFCEVSALPAMVASVELAAAIGS